MTTPSPETVAAAIRLAEAVSSHEKILGRSTTGHYQDSDLGRAYQAQHQALDAYRATLPKPAKVYDWSRVPAELWASLAHECCAEDRWTDMRPELIDAIHAVQAAAEEDECKMGGCIRRAEGGGLCSKHATLPKLRTRAEVDAEIAQVVREYGPLPSARHGAVWEIRGVFPERLMKLCAEPVAEDQ